MKPRTKLQRQIVELKGQLAPLSTAQMEWAKEHTLEHIAYRLPKGRTTCMMCGAEFETTEKETECGCPECGRIVTIKQTLKRSLKQKTYFDILAVAGGMQVVRMFALFSDTAKGHEAHTNAVEVGQYWLTPQGKVTLIGKKRTLFGYYVDNFAWSSPLEVRTDCDCFQRISDTWVCPIGETIPELERNGFEGDYFDIAPVTLFRELLSNPRIETMMKTNDITALHYFIHRKEECATYWPSYNIAKRHGYKIDNLSQWVDYLRMLTRLGKDTRNPSVICPANLKEEHDKLSRRIEAIRRREQEEADRKRQYERLQREKQNEKDFRKAKGRFFGMVIADGEIEVKVLESIQEYFEEGNRQSICVFSSEYFKKATTLVLSARIGDEIIETVEVDLNTLKVIQCHGKHNQDSEYHQRIINLVNNSADIIKARMTA